MNAPRLSACCAYGAATLLLLVTVAGGSLTPGYDHAGDFISELGAVDARHGDLVSLGGFLPIGLLVAGFVIFGWAVLTDLAQGRLAPSLLLGVALGYLLAAFAPCEPGCVAVDQTGALRQTIHNLGGLLEYAGGGLALLLFARGLRRQAAWRAFALPSLLLGITVLAVFVALAAGTTWAGAWQRLAEAALFGWMVVVATLWRRQ